MRTASTDPPSSCGRLVTAAGQLRQGPRPTSEFQSAAAAHRATSLHHRLGADHLGRRGIDGLNQRLDHLAALSLSMIQHQTKKKSLTCRLLTETCSSVIVWSVPRLITVLAPT